MKSIRNWMIASVVAMSVLFSAVEAPAQVASSARTPFATVAVANFNDIQSQVKLVGSVIGMPLEMLMQMNLSQGPGAILMKNIDQKKPMGACVFLVDGEPVPLVMVPVNLPELAKNAASLGLPIVDNRNGTFTIAGDTTAKQVGTWCFASPDSSAIALANGINPDDLLGKMAEKYTISVKLNVAAIPTPLKDELMEQIQMGMSMAKDAMEGDSPVAAFQAKNLERSIEQINMFVYESSQLLIGVKISQQNSLDFDIAMTAKPNTELAALLTGITPAPSRTYGIVPKNAALGFWQAGKMSDKLVEVQTQQLNDMFDSLDQMYVAMNQELASNLDSERASVLAMVLGKSRDLMKVLREKVPAMASNEVDGAMALTLDMGAPTLVSAGTTKDPEAVYDLCGELAKTFREVIDELPKPDASDADSLKTYDAVVNKAISAEDKTIDGLKFRIASFDVAQVAAAAPESAQSEANEAIDYMKKIWGGTKVQVAIAVSDDGMTYSAFGADAVKAIQTAAKQVDSANQPAGLVSGGFIAFAPIAKFVDDIMQIVPDAPAEAKQMVLMLGSLFDSTESRDKIIFSTRLINNGSLSTISIEEGTIKAFATFFMLSQTQMVVTNHSGPSGGGFEEEQMTDEEIEEMVQSLGLSGADADAFRNAVKGN